MSEDFDGAGYPVVPQNTGTPDSVVTVDGKLVITDLKAGVTLDMNSALSADEGLMRYALSVGALLGER